jgi:hypothetical protein
MKKLVMIVAVFIATTCASYARQNTETVTNKTIIELHKAGLGDDVIVSKIQSSVCKFDVSANTLVSLKKQGIKDAVIKAMIDKEGSGNATPATPPSNNNKVAEKETKNTKAPALEFINQVYAWYAGQNKTSPLEKVAANLKMKSKAFGFGGAQSAYEIEGEKSASRLDKNESFSFIINTGGAAPELILYKLKVEKKKREAAMVKINTFDGSAKSGENTIALNISQVSNGIYKIVPSQSLAKGEYFFASKTVTSGTTADVFAFGVD